MADLPKRIRNLTPEQRELLRRRLRQNPDRSARFPHEFSSISAHGGASEPARRRRELAFSLFFFSADSAVMIKSRYQLLLEAARLADRNGFKAVWTPERHFQAFGGLYPNPAVLSAALAMVTKRVQIRAGSLVLPLHNPVRVAEDWAVVDNLSGGRVAISFATGWHQDDFVLAPNAYEDRRELMFRNLLTVRRLWAGEQVELPGVGGKKTLVRTLPRPIQPELPCWVTVTSPPTWRRAGELGANVLTALGLGTIEDLGKNISSYRLARRENGHDPRTGIVSLMLHTYLDTDLEVTKAKVREPLKRYLQSFINQFRPLMGDAPGNLTSLEIQNLLNLAFERYFDHNSLLGTPPKCAAMMEKVTMVGVNEVACLVDFGLDLQTTLESLDRLIELRRQFQPKTVR